MRISLDINGNQAGALSGEVLSLSDDGRFVSFKSNLSTIVPGDTNDRDDAFVRDRGCAFDFECDGMLDEFEIDHSCLLPLEADATADPDADGLDNVAEHGVGTDPCVADTDTDGCADGEEVGPVQSLGGQRNPLNFWDFYDVNGDRRIDLNDTLDILGKFGETPGPPPSPAYDPLYDRYAPDLAKPWRTAADTSGNGIDLTDALVNLESFGHDCSAAP